MADRALKVYVPDRTAAVIDLPNSGMTVEEARLVLVQMGHTAVQNADYEETVVGSNGRSIKFKRVTGGTKGL